uniref:VQ domain-containing protein n=1 Tax=Opuntia streptacantha TaxID=393608 RepID=A0A7C9EMY5_OPUST
MSKNRPNEYLGVNKIGKNIRKSPLHQPNFVNSNSGIISNPGRQQPQPQVYNISKNDFRSIVQQLTGSPARQDPPPRPPSNHPKHLSTRLQRIRPPPLTPIHRPPNPPVIPAPAPMQPPPQGLHMAPPPVPFNNNNNFGRPPPQFGQPSPRAMRPLARTDWATPALSPISAYMQQLQRCIGDDGLRPGQAQMQPQPWVPGQVQDQPHMQPLLPGPMQGQPPVPQQFPGPVLAQPPSSALLPNPPVPPLPSPRMNVATLLPSPRMNGPALLPSPTSEFLLPSPSGFLNLLSPTPRSPYPLLSPSSQFPPPLSPNFAFSPIGQYGIFGPGPQHPLSPGIVFPQSPSGFFPISSPRWRDQ